MLLPNQDEPDGPRAEGPPPDDPASTSRDASRVPGPEARPDSLPPVLSAPGLLDWLITILLLGAGGLLLEQPEMAALAALAGLFIAAQAADLGAQWRLFYGLMAWLVPAGGALAYAGLAWTIRENGETGPLANLMLGWCAGASVLSLVSALPRVSDRLSRLLFRHDPPSHGLRLAARLVLIGLLIGPPGWYAMRDQFAELLKDPGLLGAESLGAGLIGYIVLALAAVGFRIRRGLAQTLERLGIRKLSARDWLITLVGVGVLFGLNGALDAVQHRWLPGLWERDNAVIKALVANLSVGQMLLIGLSAGVGEEITVRGALQPKLGILLSSLLFAALHVQYSWYGMAVIFLLGILLGLLRKRTSTSVAILVHTLYDIVAIATS